MKRRQRFTRAGSVGCGTAPASGNRHLSRVPPEARRTETSDTALRVRELRRPVPTRWILPARPEGLAGELRSRMREAPDVRAALDQVLANATRARRQESPAASKAGAALTLERSDSFSDRL